MIVDHKEAERIARRWLDARPKSPLSPNLDTMAASYLDARAKMLPEGTMPICKMCWNVGEDVCTKRCQSEDCPWSTEEKANSLNSAKGTHQS